MQREGPQWSSFLFICFSAVHIFVEAFELSRRPIRKCIILFQTILFMWRVKKKWSNVEDKRRYVRIINNYHVLRCNTRIHDTHARAVQHRQT